MFTQWKAFLRSIYNLNTIVYLKCLEFPLGMFIIIIIIFLIVGILH